MKTPCLFIISLLAVLGSGVGAFAGSILGYHPPTTGDDGISRQNYPYTDGPAAYYEQGRPVNWRIPVQELPREVVPVVGCSVMDFGAKGDGVTDDTQAFHLALNTMAAAGGGSVWVPSGRYVIRGTLVIPLNVVLEGEWEKPAPGRALRGTVLMAYAGRGSAEGTPFITLDANCAVRNLSIWYPEQSADAETPTPYPWTLFEHPKSGFKPCASVENVTLVNSYQGVFFGVSEKGHTNWYLRNIYGTPLHTGLQVDMTNDTGRLYSVDFSPDYWKGSGLPGSPAENAPVLRWIAENGTAYVIRRQDFAHWGPFSARGYGVGMRGASSLAVNQAEEWIKAYGNAQFQGHFWGIDLRDCKTAVTLSGIQEAGVLFSNSVLEGREYGVRIEPGTRFFVTFNRSRLSGGVATLQNAEPLHLGFLKSRLTGEVDVTAGGLSLVGCEITRARRLPSPETMTIQGGSFPGDWARADNGKTIKISRDVKLDAEPEPPVPSFARVIEPLSSRKGSSRLVVLGGIKNGEDITDALSARLAAAAPGDIVLIPPGYFRLSQPIRVPAGVTLRGAIDTPQHVVRAPTVLLLEPALEGGSVPVISLEKESVLAGLSFYPRTQDWREPREYPVLAKAVGPGVQLRNLSAAGVSRLAEFVGPEASGFRVDTVLANALREGVRVGGGVADGRLLNVHFISHPWTILGASWKQRWLKELWGVNPEALPVDIWEDQARGVAFVKLLQDGFDAFVVGDTQRLICFHNFTYGCRSGFVTLTENGRGPHAYVLHGAGDASIYGADIRGASPDGLRFDHYMVYAGNGEKSVALRIALPQDRSVFFDTLQTAGRTTVTLEHESGAVRFTNPSFGDIADQNFILRGGEMRAEAPFFFRPALRFSMEKDSSVRLWGAVWVDKPQVSGAARDDLFTTGEIEYQAHPALQNKTEK